VSETDREQARRLVKLGDERFAAGDFEGAHEAYQGAHLIMGVPTTGLQVARAEVALGRFVESRRTLQQVLAYPAEENEPEAFATARALAKKLDAEIEGRLPSVSVRIIGATAEQQVWVSVDGHRLAARGAAKRHRVNPGKHEVAAWTTGQPKRVREIDLAEAEHKVVQLDVTPPPPPGMVVSPLVWVGFGLAGAGTIVGAVTGGVSLSKAAEVREVCFEGRICPQSAAATRDESLALAHASTVSFAVAGLGSLLGIVGFLISGPGDPPPVQVSIAPGGVGLGVRF
jgi:hypothetical protein